ncbi:MAG TPA: hypothetical protein EYP10_11210, partial [Armatimonadetes bacterium]|nr:hypothetical protein [Armatimonadota bacterium]
MLLPRSPAIVVAVEAKIIDPDGNAIALTDAQCDAVRIFWRWWWLWTIPDDSPGDYILQVALRAADGRVLTTIAQPLGTVKPFVADLRERARELLTIARREAFNARKRNDEQACGRWATLWWHVRRFYNDFTRQLDEEPSLATVQRFEGRWRNLQDMRRNVEAGRDPFHGRTGVLEKAFLSDMDDTLQPYSVYIPPIYYNVLARKPVSLPNELQAVLAQDAELKAALDTNSFSKNGFPLVVRLHGLGGTHHLGAPSKSDVLWAVINLAPYGRGPTDYKAWGEVDVICAIREVLRDYFVDADRVYLTGTSMGGTGSWQIGTHYPDMFAAIAPVCGNADHRVWEREWNWGQSERTFLTELRNFLENCESPVFFAENLMHVPVYCVHGDADRVVPVGHSRSMVSRLRELGYAVIYDEQKGVGHGGFESGTFSRLHQWLLKQRRNRYPKRVVYKTGWLRYKGAYWVEINRFERYLQFAQIDAEIVAPNAITVRTDNVAHFTLRLNDHLIDTQQLVTVCIDNSFVYRGAVNSDGTLSFAKRKLSNGAYEWVLEAPPQGLVKSATLEGPIEVAFYSRFIIAYGTVGNDPDAVEVNEIEA